MDFQQAPFASLPDTHEYSGRPDPPSRSGFRSRNIAGRFRVAPLDWHGPGGEYHHDCYIVFAGFALSRRRAHLYQARLWWWRPPIDGGSSRFIECKHDISRGLNQIRSESLRGSPGNGRQTFSFRRGPADSAAELRCPRMQVPIRPSQRSACERGSSQPLWTKHRIAYRHASERATAGPGSSPRRF